MEEVRGMTGLVFDKYCMEEIRGMAGLVFNKYIVWRK